MLHYSTVYPNTLQLLEKLQRISDFEDFHLVGGTSLALQIGHRISIDLDLFAHHPEAMDMSSILEIVEDVGNVRIDNQSQRILNLHIDDIKVDFVSYRYDFIDDIIMQDDLRLASMTDIAAMKLSAIAGRGSKKDFIDLYFLLEHYSLAEMMGFYKSKYSDGNDFMVLRSLTYFDDAENEPMPKMLAPTSWASVKDRVKLAVSKYTSA